MILWSHLSLLNCWCNILKCNYVLIPVCLMKHIESSLFKSWSIVLANHIDPRPYDGYNFQVFLSTILHLLPHPLRPPTLSLPPSTNSLPPSTHFLLPSLSSLITKFFQISSHDSSSPSDAASLTIYWSWHLIPIILLFFFLFLFLFFLLLLLLPSSLYPFHPPFPLLLFIFLHGVFSERTDISLSFFLLVTFASTSFWKLGVNKLPGFQKGFGILEAIAFHIPV